jgi:hypothetical protein
MGVIFSFDELHGLAGPLERGGEVAVLTLEIRCFQTAVGDRDGRNNLVDVTLRTHGIDHRIGEVNVGAAPRETNRRQFVHPAYAKPTLHDRGGDAKVLFPIGNECHAAKMTARRVATDINTIRVTVERRSILVNPRNGASHLRRRNGQIPRYVFD